MSENLSKTISFLRFPLICVVVLIHAEMDRILMGVEFEQVRVIYPVFGVVKHLFGGGQIGAIAVPLFFFISGYLFFKSTPPPIFLNKFYIKKLKSRFRTLFIPYIFWNILAFIITVMVLYLTPSMLGDEHKLLSDYQVQDWLNIFWTYKHGTPANPPFWFLRDLIVMVIASPIIYFIVHKLRVFGIAILSILFIFDLWFTSSPGFSIVAIFFFTFGAFFSLNNLNFVDVFRKIKIPSTIILLALIIIGTILGYLQIKLPILTRIGVISGIISIIAWTSIGIEKSLLKVNSFLLSATFFVYASHIEIEKIILHLYIKIVEPSSDLSLIIGFFSSAIITIVIGLILFKILKTIFPRFTALITGGR